MERDSVNTSTVLIRPFKLPLDAVESGVYAVAATSIPSPDDIHECSHCGGVDFSGAVSRAAFVRSSTGPSEGDILCSLADWVRSRKPARVVVVVESHRSVLRDRASRQDCMNGFIGNIDVLCGVSRKSPRDVLDAAGVSFDFPVLRGTTIMYSDVDGVGEKVTIDADGVEVNAVRAFGVREVGALLRALIQLDSLAFMTVK